MCKSKEAYIIILYIFKLVNGQFVTFSDSDGEDNRSCKIFDTNQIGACTKLINCPSVIENFFKIRPQICHFEGAEPIICCPNEEQPMDDRFRLISEKRCAEIYNIPPGCKNCFCGGGGFGGTPAEDMEFPHMAALGWIRYDRGIDFRCGGFLVDKTFVITAAHCIRTKPNIVRLGGVPLLNGVLIPSDIEVADVYIHPKYHPQQSYYDIAILELAWEANDTVSKPACLFTEEHIYFTHLTAIGYGDTTFHGDSSDVLIKLHLTVYDNEVCQKNYPRYSYHKLNNGIVGSQLCAGHPNGEQDTCSGDSGGPIGDNMLVNCAAMVPYVMGVTSFGSGCGGSTAAVYTRISSYLNWIVPIVWPNYKISEN